MLHKRYFNNPTGQGFHYELSLPADYDPQNRYPLVVFLHGAGERGNPDGSELELVERNGWFWRVAAGEEFSAIMVAPQCPTGKYWGCYTESLNKFLDTLIGNYAVDEKRVSLTGLSMGGTGTWMWGMANPERFSAFAPVCGSGIVWYGEQFVTKPVWAFHGDVDSIVPAEESLHMVAAVNRRGGHARLTLFHGVDHDSWVQAYAGRELFDWLIAQQL